MPGVVAGPVLLLLLVFVGTCNAERSRRKAQDEDDVLKSLFSDARPEFDEEDVKELGSLFTSVFAESKEQLIVDLDLFRALFEYQDAYRQAIQTGNTQLVRAVMAVVNRLKEELDVSAGCMADVFHLSWSALEYATYIQEARNCTECQCTPYLKQQRNERQWIFNVLDAFGKMPAGVTGGNNLWVGSWNTCRKISVVKNRQGQRWSGQYCLAHLNAYYRDNPLKAIASTRAPDAHCFEKEANKTNDEADEDEDSGRCFDMIPLLNFGLCMPDSCTDYDVQKMTSFAIRGVEAAVGRALVCNVTVECRNERKESGISEHPLAMAALLFVILLAILVVFGSLYDAFVWQNEVLQLAPWQVKEYYAKAPFFLKVLLAFSAYTNGRAVLETREERGGQIACLFGMRFLSMAWIILGHTYYYLARSLTTDNLIPTMISFPQQFYTQIIVQAPLAVDSFFYLSGMLSSYLFFKKIIKDRQLKNPSHPVIWILYYLRRYVRLTPVYVVIMWLNVTLFTYASDGPFWRPIETTYCRHTWWVNLLYFNNFLLQHIECCMGWTWYLANDFQFHVVLTPLLIITLTRSAKLGLSISGVLIAISTFIKFYVMEIYEYPPAPLLTAKLTIVEKLDSYWTDVYVKPYIRCPPFICGVVVGFLIIHLTRHKKNKNDISIQLSRGTVIAGWTMSTILGMYSVFGLYEYSRTGEISDWWRILYVVAGRNGYALAISWVTFACATGNGGMVNTILAWKFFTPLGRITYGAYLIHPILMQVYNLSRPQPFHFTTFFQMLRHAFEGLVVSYFAAFIVHLMVEAPMSTFEALLFNKLTPARKPEKKELVRVEEADSGETSGKHHAPEMLGLLKPVDKEEDIEFMDRDTEGK